VMFNTAFYVGGVACTEKTVESLKGVKVDHWVVVDFNGFKDMVDAIGGVVVCVPHAIDDDRYQMHLEAGTQEIRGQEALDYVRVRHGFGDGSDIGRISRQQAFMSSMVNKVVSAGVLARPDRLIGFLDAATQSLTVDKGLESVAKIADLGLQFRSIGLAKIQFVTVPFEYDQREEYRGRISWLPEAKNLWASLAADEPLTRRLTDDAISAAAPPGSEGPSGSPSGSPGGSPSGESSEEAQAEADAAGLCA
jgi:LCP family protein required for cell wall assembly